MLIHFLYAYSRESVIRFQSTHSTGMPPIFHADGIYTQNYCYGFIKRQRFISHSNGAPFQSFASNPSLKLALRSCLQSDPAAPSCLQTQVVNMSACNVFPVSEDHQSPSVRRTFSISPFGFIPMRILLLWLHKGEQLLENGFGVSLLTSFPASFRKLTSTSQTLHSFTDLGVSVFWCY